ncbi:MAG: GNAT family N-acetyltransferase, partial [Phyllobacteriaceae bacterium]|nr:GNAT family N-acetyltransferase [Phyllobacteriaceae bacterium]
MGLFHADPSERLPTLVGERVLLRGPDRADFEVWRALRTASRAFLEPWEPLWASDDLVLAAFRRRLARWSEEIGDGVTLPFFVFARDGGALLGGVTLSQVRRGVTQTGTVGYWMGEPHAGKGFMSEAVGVLARHAFGPFGLHRLEAACLPDNLRSIRLLEKVGFAREGLARAYLCIAGDWRDHLLWGLLVGDPLFPNRPSTFPRADAVGSAARALV